MGSRKLAISSISIISPYWIFLIRFSTSDAVLSCPAIFVWNEISWPYLVESLLAIISHRVDLPIPGKPNNRI